MNIISQTILNLFSFSIWQVWSEYEHFEAPIFLTNFSEITFLTRNCAHAQERVMDTMWGMALARSLDCSTPVNFFSILGLWVHLIVFGKQ